VRAFAFADGYTSPYCHGRTHHDCAPAVLPVPQLGSAGGAAARTLIGEPPLRHDGVIHSRQEGGVDDPWKLRIAMYFDRETVALLRTALDRARAGLPPSQQARTSRSVLAERILKAAAQGERDADRLRAWAVMEVASTLAGFSGARPLVLTSEPPNSPR
jgi:hypothetical protein